MSQVFDLKSVKEVFHCSPQSGLQVLRPRVSTHGESWVYATPFLEIACTYLAKWDDLDFAQSMNGDDFYLVERYPNAFMQIFPQAKGSLYHLPIDSFESFNYMEAVSREPVYPLKETIIENSWEFINEVASQRNLHLHYYPHRPSFIPEDDSDLVAKVSKWIQEEKKTGRESALYSRFCLKHPNLVGRL